MFGDALAFWYIAMGLVYVLAIAAIIFAISWRLTRRPRSAPGDQASSADQPPADDSLDTPCESGALGLSGMRKEIYGSTARSALHPPSTPTGL